MSPPLPGWTESGSGTVIDLGRKLWAETTPPLRGNGVWEGSGERPLKLPRTVRQGSCFDCPGGTHPYLWPELLEPEDHSSCSTISARREQILMGLEGCTSRWLKYPGEEGRNWINIMAVRKDKEILSPAR